MRARVGELADRLRYHLGAAAVAAGLALSVASTVTAAAAAALALVAGTACRRAPLGALCASLVVAAAGVGEWRLDSIDAPGERLDAFAPVDADAVLLERPRGDSVRARAPLQLTSGPATGAKLLAVAERRWPGPDEPGTIVRVHGVAKPPLSADQGFDWAAHLRRRGIAYELALTSIKATGRSRGGIAGTIDSARRRAERAIEAGLPPEKAALLRGMVLGQDESIDALTRDDWRDAGLAHLLAVSGQNVMLLCALALPLLALGGAAPRTRVAALAVLIALYVPLAGAGPSLQRAAVMGVAGLVALTSSRPRSAAYGLLLAAVATLAANPRIAGDPGWQLSFAAVTAILAARPLAPRGPVAGALWLTAVASVATTPLLALHFEAVPLAAVPANLAALPAVAPAMWAGMLEAAIGQLTALGTVGEAAARSASAVIDLFCEPFLAWLTFVAARFAELPHTVAVVSLPGPGGVAAAYLTLASVGYAAARVAGRVGPYVDEVRARTRVASARSLAAGALALAVVTVVVGARVVSPSAPDRLTVSFLSVGQGDATLVQHPDGTAVLFDGGPADARAARLLRQAGVSSLSVVVATHASADHHGGLAEVIRRFPVELLVDGGDGTADPEFRQVLTEAREHGVPVRRARAGQVIRAGGVAISVLSPPLRPPGPPPADPNPRAVVAVVESGSFALFLSADAESPSLVPLDLPDVDAMKVPHHGSADPGLGEVLRRLRPEVAVIEVGENSYGHPHPDTLRALDRAVPHVRRTDEDGTVKLVVTEDRMVLE